MNKKELQQFNNHFMSFMEAFEKLKSQQHANVIDQSITASEVHLIVTIENHQPINLVKLAEIQNISRSAVTQSSKRLIQKGLISLTTSPKNGKNKYLQLTGKGKKIYQLHQTQQDYIENAVLTVLETYSQEDLNKVTSLMADIKAVWENLPW